MTDAPAAGPALLVVVSGPSGVGKDAVLNRLKELGRPYHFTITATTRPARASEQDGIDYRFLRREAFDELISRGDLLEWAKVYQHYYGVPKAQVRQALEQGKHVLVRTDIQGAETIRKLVPGCVLVFLAPPSLDELEQRLRERSANHAADLEMRLRTARREMEAASWFDYVIVNRQGRLDQSAAALDAIITAESHRSTPHAVTL